MKSIKEECDDLYQIIDKAQERLEEIRATCPHTNQYTGSYSWRVGTTVTGVICEDCGEFLKSVEKDLLNWPHKQLDLFMEKEEDNGMG